LTVYDKDNVKLGETGWTDAMVVFEWIAPEVEFSTTPISVVEGGTVVLSATAKYEMFYIWEMVDWSATDPKEELMLISTKGNNGDKYEIPSTLKPGVYSFRIIVTSASYPVGDWSEWVVVTVTAAAAGTSEAPVFVSAELEDVEEDVVEDVVEEIIEEIEVIEEEAA